MLFKVVLSLHVIGFVCWFAALFYLPRLFVYHAMNTDQNTLDQFKIMEYKLYRYIMYPAAIVTIISGIALIHLHGFIDHGWWLQAKVVLVALLIIYHLSCGFFVKRFAADNNKQSHKFFRIFNEAPTILLIIIVLLAVIQP